MEAIVKVINANRGMYAAEIDGSGEFVILSYLIHVSRKSAMLCPTQIFIAWAVKLTKPYTRL